jgi:large subunit ribosomal protein L10
MPAAQKTQTIDELAGLLDGADMMVLTEYRGLPTPELRRMRLALRPHNAEYHITKNTLLRLAARRVGKEALESALTGPTAVAFIKGDLAEPVKVLSDFVRTSRNVLVIKGGMLGSTLMSAADVTQIAELPPRDQLIAQVVGQFQAPIANLVFVLNNPIQALAYTLQARVDQQGGESAA